MNPYTLIEKDLGAEQFKISCESFYKPIKVMDEISIFSTYKLYYVYGKTREFDFPMLPHGCYAIYAANGKEAIRLTRKDREIEQILKAEWYKLTNYNPVELATIVLKFFDGGIKASHEVIRDIEEFKSFYCQEKSKCEYIVNDKEFLKISDKIGKTEFLSNSDECKIRAVTLMGWMHEKKNLGIEMINISKEGKVALDKREVLSKNVFKQTPMIKY